MSKRRTVLVLALLPLALAAQKPLGKINDQRIVELVAMGISEQEVIRLISVADKFDFDLRPESTDAMLKRGVSEEIIKAMAARESGVAVETAAPSPTVNPDTAQRPGFSGAAKFAPISTATPNAVNGSSSSNPPISNSLAASTQQYLKMNQYAVVRALGNRVIPFHTSFNLNLPGNVRTSCYGNGSWSYSSVSCSSWVNPPTQIPIDIVRVDVYQQVALGGQTYTLKCTSHWLGSSCNSLRTDDNFRAQIRGTTVRIEAHRGGNMGKLIRPKYRVLDIR